MRLSLVASCFDGRVPTRLAALHCILLFVFDIWSSLYRSAAIGLFADV